MAYRKIFKIINQACFQISVTFGEAGQFIPFCVQCLPILPPCITSPSFNYLSMHSKMMSLIRVHESFQLRVLMTTGFVVGVQLAYGPQFPFFLPIAEGRWVRAQFCEHYPPSCHSAFGSVRDYAFERSLVSFWWHKGFETVFLSKLEMFSSLKSERTPKDKWFSPVQNLNLTYIKLL